MTMGNYGGATYKSLLLVKQSTVVLALSRNSANYYNMWMDMWFSSHQIKCDRVRNHIQNFVNQLHKDLRKPHKDRRYLSSQATYIINTFQKRCLIFVKHFMSGVAKLYTECVLVYYFNFSV